MSVILISKRPGSKDNTRSRAYDGYLIAEFILLVLFAFADALNLWFMNGINLLEAVTFL